MSSKFLVSLFTCCILLSISANGQMVKGISPNTLNTASAENLLPMSNSLDTKPKTDTSLKEIIVIGYGTTKSKDATGSVASISTKDFNTGAINSAEQLIIGKVAGVNITQGSGKPGAAPTIRIRGTSSLSANNDPLYVIDGVPVDNAGVSGLDNPMSMINPNDIENMVVLKDASSTAIYGSRAANGVIIITTKKGSGKMKVSVSSNFSLGTITRIVESMSTKDFKSLILEEGSLIQKSLVGTSNTNWQEPLYQVAVGTDNNVSIAGNDLHKSFSHVIKSMPYRLSLGYNYQEGVLKTSTFDRYSLSLNINPQFEKINLKTDISLKGTWVGNRFADESAIKDAISFDPTQSIKSEEGAYQRYGGYFEWINSDGTLNVLAPKNPVSKLFNVHNTSNVGRFIGNIKFDYTVHHLKELKATLILGYDIQTSMGKNMADTFAAVTNRKGRNDSYGQTRKNQLLDFYINYNKELINWLGIDASVGYSYQKFTNESNSITKNLVDPLVVNTVNSGINLLVSYWGRVNIKLFDSRYLITTSLRADGSSRFAAENQFGYFPAVAFAWNVGEESFMESTKAILSQLKLRASWGITGQQDIGDFQFLPTYVISDNQSMYQLGNNFYTTYRPSAYNSTIKWEQTATTNIGIDYGFWGNRVNGSVELYLKKTTDLLNSIYVPAGSNLTNKITSNIGAMENRGIEATVHVAIIQNKKVKWNVGANLTYNTNKITKITINDNPNFMGVQVGGISGATGNTIQINATGNPVNSFYVYQQIYGEDGKPIEGLYQDVNSDGLVNDKDFIKYKQPAANLILGFNSSASYFGFDLSLSMRASLGNYVYDNVSSEKGNLAFLTQNTFLTSATTDALHTRFSKMQPYSDYYIKNASFLRMDFISLGYSFSFKEHQIKARVALMINNVFVLTQYTGIDPEISGGIDNTIYPRPRTYSIGLKVDF